MGVSPRLRRVRFGGGPYWLDVGVSVLPASVAVMAPALTEGGPQNPEKLLPQLSAGSFLTTKHNLKIRKSREFVAQLIVSANIQSKIDEQCLRDVPKDLIHDVIDLQFDNFEDLSKLIVGKKNSLKLDSAIMNDPSMGDPANSMGFFNKESTDGAAESYNAREITKDNTTIETDKTQNHNPNEDEPQENRTPQQIITFDSNIIPNNSDLSQNVDEILQVIKSIANDENFQPSDLQSSENVTEIFPETFAFDRDLITEEDVMGLCSDNVVDNSEQQTKRLEDDILHKQQLVQDKQSISKKRCSSLLHRLRKLQTQWLGQHCAGEVINVLELAHDSAKKTLRHDLETLGPKASNMRNLPEITGNLESFFSKVEKSCVAQSNSLAARQRNYFKYFGSGSRDNYVTSTNRHPGFGVPQIKLDGKEVESVAGPLSTQLRTLQNNYDSDATASSSGGESCDEMQSSSTAKQHLPIQKRALWRYAKDRAAIASRWTWLTAQISDLEFKIHHYNEIQKSIKSSKGAVKLEITDTVNGYSSGLPNSSKLETELPTSRTRPFIWNNFRKRKILKIDGLHEVSKRIAKPSTIRCDCDGLLPPCIICTGRSDPTVPLEPIEQLSLPERIARVDPSFHPVLSLPEETLLSTHLSAIFKNIDWQQKWSKGSIRLPKSKDLKDGTEKRNNKKPADAALKQTVPRRRTTLNTVTPKVKQKASKGRANKTNLDKCIPNVNKKRSNKVLHLEEGEEANVVLNSSKHSSPVPSPLQLSSTATFDKNTLKEKSTGYSHSSRLRQNSYDIDNIVIPHSVAATARPEKLQYKEILIPKWRICDNPNNSDVKNGVLHKSQPDSDVEDVSEETIQQRHERSEKEEYKRFMNFSNVPNYRPRPNRRADSRADSGTNTPDPLSPHTSDFGFDPMSPIRSPLEMQNLAENEHLQDLSQRSSSLQSVLRRRTIISGIQFARNDNEEEREQILPYDPRSFPLPDEVYEQMLIDMPDGHWQTNQNYSFNENEDKPCDMDFNESDSTESALCDLDNEDPNDPEWTVSETRDTEKEKIRPTAKR